MAILYKVHAIIGKVKEYLFSERIKQFREALALTQQEAADMLELSKRQIQKYESGEVVPEGIKLAKLIKSIAELQAKQKSNDRTLIRGIQKLIPIYDVDVSAGNIQMFDDSYEEATDYWKITPVQDCQFAVRTFGSSMYPTYENGTTIFCKPILDKQLIAYGECYLIITDELRVVKRIVKSDTPENILAVSDNTEALPDGRLKYGSFEIPKDKIRRLYLIKGCFKEQQN